MPKILFVATVPEHFRYFHLPCFRMLREHGYEVHIACADAQPLPDTDKQFAIPIGRSPLDPQNLRGIRALRKIIDGEQYDLIHAHTPMGGFVARCAAGKARRHGTRVLYTAHGFHFYKGAALTGWLVLFPVEWLMSFRTDTLLTINEEDYARAKARLHAKETVYIHGVGCDTARFVHDNGARDAMRAAWQIAPSDPVLVYVAEMNANKHQDLLIRAVKSLQRDWPTVQLILVGADHYDGTYKRLAEQLHAPVRFLGERRDVPDILSACDIYAASSLREGLPVNIMEAMAEGLPVVALRNRGHCALVRDGETGYIVDSQPQMEEKLRALLEDRALCRSFGENGRVRVADYDVHCVLRELQNVYFR